jgi:hypothetical protein
MTARVRKGNGWPTLLLGKNVIPLGALSLSIYVALFAPSSNENPVRKDGWPAGLWLKTQPVISGRWDHWRLVIQETVAQEATQSCSWFARLHTEGNMVDSISANWLQRCLKNNFTLMFQMLICGECYENFYTVHRSRWRYAVV